MAITGIEGAIASNILGPVVKALVSSASDSLAVAFKKWEAKGFERKLATKVASASKVKTIWSPEKETSLLTFYYPSKVSELEDDKRSKNTIEVSSLADIGRENVVLQGTVGQGKSIFLRYLAVQELSEKGTGRIPILVELRTITAKKDLRHQIDEGLEKLDLKMDKTVFDYLANSGKIVLLLDGFDELEQSEAPDTLSTIEFLVEKYPSLQIVVTSRPQNGIQNSRLFNVLNLCPLTSDDYRGFLLKMGIKAARCAEIIEAISQSGTDIKNLITTPLMLTLLVLVYQSEKKIPTEFSDFFEVLFHTVFTKHDSLKTNFQRKHYSGLSEKKLELLFESFCFMVMQNGFGRSVKADEFETAFSHAIDYVDGCNCLSDNFKKDITKVSCLMLEEGFNLVTFLHKSIMEYFASSFIKHCADPSAKRFYNKVLEKAIPWRQVLSFLSVIDAYRYQLHYTIPGIENFFSLLDSKPSDVSGVSSAKLVALLKKYFDRFEITFHRAKDDSKLGLASITTPVTSSTTDKGIGLIFDRLSYAIVDGIVSSSGKVSDASFEERMVSSKYFVAIESKQIYSIKLPAFLKEFGEDEIVVELQVQLERLRSEWSNAKAMIEREQEKSLIFERRR